MKFADYFNVSLDFLTGRQYTEIELDDLFTSNAQLNFNGHPLTVNEKVEVYGMIKGYLNGKKNIEKALNDSQSTEMTLPLDD